MSRRLGSSAGIRKFYALRRLEGGGKYPPNCCEIGDVSLKRLVGHGGRLAAAFRRAVTIASGQILRVLWAIALKYPCEGMVFAGQFFSAMAARKTASRDDDGLMRTRGIDFGLGRGERSDFDANHRGGAVSGLFLKRYRIEYDRKGSSEAQRIESGRLSPLFSKSSAQRKIRNANVSLSGRLSRRQLCFATREWGDA
ncbi:hypothetical protein BDN72DRAFT_479118 [Pluteus cervinus]|uniref:Uncharacterized protein n=1 Tax=Pluteus cervinus TaxID=181527 RepID=A0ACD3AZE8_9AGAR|nr:hypothetical protein BDN72DRAFT_479118 [Pluteus cervinus]